ncbi:MAG: hypothetical protein MJE77_07215 [Proteobacteria bacterium]|nr:hypothetical protein [Pseudomonadota bacterium]
MRSLLDLPKSVSEQTAGELAQVLARVLVERALHEVVDSSCDSTAPAAILGTAEPLGRVPAWVS